MSNTQIEDKGVQALASYLNKTENKIIELNLTNAGITAKGITPLCTGNKSNSLPLVQIS